MSSTYSRGVEGRGPQAVRQRRTEEGATNSGGMIRGLRGMCEGKNQVVRPSGSNGRGSDLKQKTQVAVWCTLLIVRR